MSALNSSKRCILRSLALFLLTAVPLTALAAKPALSPAVQALVTAAEKEYKAGEYGRASELYEQAWKSVSSDTQLLFNAARAAHLGKQFERADKLYRQFLAQPEIEPKYADKATAYLPDVDQALQAARAAEAKDKARDAEQFQRDKRYREAAAAYRDAYRLDTAKLDYLFRAGLAASFGCDVAVAKLYLGEYLQKAPADAADRGEAQVRLAGVERDCGGSAPNLNTSSQSVAPQDVPQQPVPAVALPVAGGGVGDGSSSVGGEYGALLASATPSGWANTLSVFAGPGMMTHRPEVSTLVGARVFLNPTGGWRTAVQVSTTLPPNGSPTMGQVTFDLGREAENWAFRGGLGLGLYDMPESQRCQTDTDGYRSCDGTFPVVMPIYVDIERRLRGRIGLFLRMDTALSFNYGLDYAAAHVGAYFNL